jgi:hypothetical protein
MDKAQEWAQSMKQCFPGFLDFASDISFVVMGRSYFGLCNLLRDGSRLSLIPQGLIRLASHSSWLLGIHMNGARNRKGNNQNKEKFALARTSTVPGPGMASYGMR